MVANIWVAAADNHIDVVQEHLKSGNFSPNSKDPNGYTPIHAAASYGHTELLRLLISHGGDINITDNEGDSPLHHVEDLNTAKIMVEELTADWKVKNNEGKTPAQYIEEDDEFPEVLQYLRSLNHDAPEIEDGSSVLDSLPAAGAVDGHDIRFTVQESQPENEIDDEKRRKIEAIINGDNPEEALRELIKDAVHQQFNQPEEDSPAPKKRRN